MFHANKMSKYNDIVSYFIFATFGIRDSGQSETWIQILIIQDVNTKSQLKSIKNFTTSKNVTQNPIFF